MSKIKTCQFNKEALNKMLSHKDYKVVSKTTKGKYTKLIIKLAIGLVIIIVIIAGVMVSSRIHAAGVNEYSIQDINDVFGSDNMFASGDLIGGVAGEGFHNAAELVENLGKISQETGCKDIPFLKYIVSKEKIEHLQKGELLSLIFGEGEFKHDITHMDGDSLSYGCSQMKKGTADMAYNYLTARGISIQKPTEELLQNDKYYLVDLTAKYLSVLHSKYGSGINKVFAYYNCGEGNNVYQAAGFVYKYTINGVKNMAHFAAMLGNAY